MPISSDILCLKANSVFYSSQNFLWLQILLMGNIFTKQQENLLFYSKVKALQNVLTNCNLIGYLISLITYNNCE